MIRGKVRECAPTRIEHTMNANIHNRFDIEVRDAKTNQLKQKAQAFNVICNKFWEYLGNHFNYIVYGDGYGIPSASDTKLFGTWNYKAPSGWTYGSDIKTGVSSLTGQIVLSETTAVGMTITEVGLSYHSGPGYLCTHAMLQDMNGNPISITKTSTDIITIYATMYVHYKPTGYCDNTIVLGSNGGVIHACLGYSGWTFGGVYVGKGTCKMGSGGSVSREYDATDRTITATLSRFSVSDHNWTGGFGWIALGDNGESTTCVIDVRNRYEVIGESVGTGDGTTTDFATKFDFPTEATVYINGMPMTSGVTVKNEPITTNPFEFLVRIQNKLYDGKPVFTGGKIALSAVDSGSALYFYNTRHDLGIYKWSNYHYAYMSLQLSFSDDFVNWSDYYSYETVIPEEYRHCKYVRARGGEKSNTWPGYIDSNIAVFPPYITGKNIVFDEPPPAGSVITIDYVTPFVPKDENHVYDLSFVVQLGEYAEG